MLKEEFVKTDRLIINYFVPFTSGKFVATCLMFSDDVTSMYDESPMVRLNNAHWSNVEYSDMSFWWKDHTINWYHNANWFENINQKVFDSIEQNKYFFYTCHDTGVVDHIKYNILPNAKVLMIIPDYELCRKNYQAKNWMVEEPNFETSRVSISLREWEEVNTDLTFDQRHIYDETLFVNAINDLATKLNITLDMNQVLHYRNTYLSHQLNK